MATEKKLVSTGQVTLVDLTDSNYLMSYISIDNRRQVLYSPNNGNYEPNYADVQPTLVASLYTENTGASQINKAQNIRWSVKENSVGDWIELSTGSDYTVDKEKLTIKTNVLNNFDSMLYRVDMTYIDSKGNEVPVSSTFELVKITLGKDGDDGVDGVGLSGIEELYLATDQKTGVTTSTTGWTYTIQQMSESKPYLWTYNETTYTDGHVENTTPVLIGHFASDGKDGYVGKDGLGIEGITEYYLISNQNVGILHSNSGWVTKPPTTTNEKRYLWNYMDIEYSDGSHEYSLPAVIGTYGEKGDKGDTGERGLRGLQGSKGDQGIQGPKGLDSYTHIAYANNETGTSGFSTSDPVDKVYIGMYVDNTKADSDNPNDYKWTLIKGSDGSQGIQGPEGIGGITPYFHTAYANSADGTVDFSVDNSSDKEYIGQYTSYARTGKGRNLVLETSGETHFDFHGYNELNPHLVSDEFLKEIMDGGKLTASVYIEEILETGPSGIALMVSFRNKTTGAITQPASPQFMFVGDSGKLSFTFSYNDRPYIDGDYCEVHIRGVSPKGSNVGTYSQLKLEKGSEATPHSIAPEDAMKDSTSPSIYSWTRVKGDKGDKGESTVLLTLLETNGNMIKNHEGTLTLEALLTEGSNIVDDVTFNWYVLEPSASGDSLSGSGWRKMSSSNKTLTVDADDITNWGVFRVIVPYKGTNYEATATLQDITDPYTVETLGANVFPNGQGTVTLVTKVYQNGEEIDTNGNEFNYSWVAYNNSGTKLSFSKSGKEITVKADEVPYTANLRCEVTRK